MQPNKYPGQCANCGTHVEAMAGGCRKQGGAWLVYCCEHKAAPGFPAGVVAAAATPDEDDPPAEVRITGSPAQCEAVREALVTGLGLYVGACSGPHPARDPYDRRVMVMARVTVDAATTALIERELRP